MAQPKDLATNGAHGAAANKRIGNKMLGARWCSRECGRSAGARLNWPKGWLARWDWIGPKDDGWHAGIGSKDGWHNGRSLDGMKDESVFMEHHISTICATY